MNLPPTFKIKVALKKKKKKKKKKS